MFSNEFGILIPALMLRIIQPTITNMFYDHILVETNSVMKRSEGNLFDSSNLRGSDGHKVEVLKLGQLVKFLLS